MRLYMRNILVLMIRSLLGSLKKVSVEAHDFKGGDRNRPSIDATNAWQRCSESSSWAAGRRKGTGSVAVTGIDLLIDGLVLGIGFLLLIALEPVREVGEP